MRIPKTFMSFTIGTRTGKNGLKGDTDSPSGSSHTVDRGEYDVNLEVENGVLDTKDMTFAPDDFKSDSDNEPAVLKNLPKHKKKSKRRQPLLVEETGSDYGSGGAQSPVLNSNLHSSRTTNSARDEKVGSTQANYNQDTLDFGIYEPGIEDDPEMKSGMFFRKASLSNDGFNKNEGQAEFEETYDKKPAAEKPRQKQPTNENKKSSLANRKKTGLSLSVPVEEAEDFPEKQQTPVKSAGRKKPGLSLTVPTGEKKDKTSEKSSARTSEKTAKGPSALSLAVPAEDTTSNSDGGEDKNLGIKPTVENDFVFGTQIFSSDGTFHDGGFRITRAGIVQAPGMVRVSSQGELVDNVPPSTTNIIYIKSLRDIEYIASLGAGASGQVQLAHHKESMSKMAVKIVNVYDEEKRKQLLKELATLTTYVSRFLVRFYGAFYDGSGAVHVVLEYMDSGSLDDAIKIGGKIPEEVTKQIAMHCLRGLAFLHQYNVLHRDFKSANILLSRRLNRSKLADFGLAKELGEVSQAATFVGTMAYLSPERLKGSQYTTAGDIWGLGISICECLLGRFPFEKPDSYFEYLENAMRGEVLVSRANISPEARDFVSACLQVDPRERPSATELMKHPFVSGMSNVKEFAKWLEHVRALRKSRKKQQQQQAS